MRATLGSNRHLMRSNEKVTEASAAKAPRPLRRPVPAWEQQPGENDLWFARFLRYVALGPTRSMSLVAKGMRNAYPVPAHWPMVSKRDRWPERAKAFDEAAKADQTLVPKFNKTMKSFSGVAANGEGAALMAAYEAGGYQVPEEDPYADDLDTRVAN